MKPGKSIFCVLILTLIASAVFAGCAGSKTEGTGKETTKSSDSQTASSKEEDEESDMAGNMYKEGLPIVREKISLDFLVKKHSLSGNFEEMAIVKEMEDDTNIKINFEVVSSAGWDEKKNLRLASGDLPDVISGIQSVTTSDITRYGPQGYFIPLEGLIDEYGVNITKVFNDNPDYRKGQVAPDGHIYSLPMIHELLYRDAPVDFMINKTWLDNLGLEVPTTTEEYYDVLKAFKEGDPNKNGDTDDEYPLSCVLNYGVSDIKALFGAFGVMDTGKEDSHLMVQKGKVLFAPVQQGYKEGIKYLARLYKEGLLDQESFTQDNKQWKAKGKAQKLGSFLVWLDANTVGTEAAKNDYIAIPPLKGPNGDQLWYKSSNTIDVGHFVITSANEYPAETLRWADRLFEPEMSLQICRGKYGVNIIKNADGTIDFVKTPEGMSYGEFRFKNTPGDVYPYRVGAEQYEKINLVDSQNRKLKEHYPLYKDYLPEEVYPQVFLTEQQEETLAILKTDVVAYVEKMRAQWITGHSNVDDDWDKYLEQLNKMRLPEMIQIYQDALDVYNRN